MDIHSQPKRPRLIPGLVKAKVSKVARETLKAVCEEISPQKRCLVEIRDRIWLSNNPSPPVKVGEKLNKQSNQIILSYLYSPS